MKLPERIREVVESMDTTRGLYYNVNNPTAEFLHFLVKLLRPKRIVEVGTANGYSSIIMGSAARDFGGSVITIERNGRLVERATENIAKAGLQDTVTVYPGSAYKILERLTGEFDLVFFDATKQEYLGYFERVRDKISSNGLILADNVISHEEELEEFVRKISDDRRISVSILPIGNGLLAGMFNQQKEPIEKRHISALGELVSSVAPRIFQGTASDVQSGKIFLHNLYEKAEGKSQEKQFNEMDGYEEALFEESLKR
jgi:predicted O-methyltransferase YrrM